MSIFLDLVMYTYTNIKTFFFLNVLNTQNIYLIIFYGLVIDFIVLNNWGLITLILIFLYFINNSFKNFVLKNIFNYFFAILILGIEFSIQGLIFQFVFIYLNYKHIIKW